MFPSFKKGAVAPSCLFTLPCSRVGSAERHSNRLRPSAHRSFPAPYRSSAELAPQALDAPQQFGLFAAPASKAQEALARAREAWDRFATGQAEALPVFCVEVAAFEAASNVLGAPALASLAQAMQRVGEGSGGSTVLIITGTMAGKGSRFAFHSGMQKPWSSASLYDTEGSKSWSHACAAMC